MTPVLTYLTLALIGVMLLMLVNLWDAAQERAKKLGSWKKLELFVWIELVIGMPFLVWMIILGILNIMGLRG